MALTVDSVIKDIQRKEYIEAMKETKYGWESSKSKKFKHIDCPNDLWFINDSDLPHPRNCIVSCDLCWKYVLNKKWGNE